MRKPIYMLSRARNLRKNLTNAERKLWGALRAHRLDGLAVRRQAPCGPFIADFLCHDTKLVIELDGATHSTDDEIAYDRRREFWFVRNGWRVLRFTNDEVYKNFDGVIETILDRVRNTPSAALPHSLRSQERGNIAAFTNDAANDVEQKYRSFAPSPAQAGEGSRRPGGGG